MISGLLLIDKPVGPTSHDGGGRLRRVGHAGTLDPLAGGVLLIGLGQTTRLLEYLVGLDKVYETTIRLGQTTTTYDAEGEVIAEQPVAVTSEEIVAALPTFRGPIRQRVPAFSAVKRDGQPLYQAARRDKPLDDLPEREVTIHNLDLLAYEPPLLTLRVACSSGTYVRSLAHDLGAALGCGGHVAALRRTAVGSFTLAEAVPLDALSAENLADHLLPPEAAVAHLPRLEVGEADAARLALGQRLAAHPDAAVGHVAAFGPYGHFLGIVEVDGEVLRPRKMLNLV